METILKKVDYFKERITKQIKNKYWRFMSKSIFVYLSLDFSYYWHKSYFDLISNFTER